MGKITQQDIPPCTKGNTHSWQIGTQWWEHTWQVTQHTCAHCDWTREDHDNVAWDNKHEEYYVK